MWHERGRGEVHAGSWWTFRRESDHLEEQGVDGIILKWIFTWDRKAWTGCSGQVQGQVAGVCECSKCTFGFHKMREIS